ncbi:glycoside hydrolase/deacetylase [Marasmius fiardii PR-910]|nr:glycoside hydrolase/deacetylase [Marasmius fiardii PR-910]
MTFRSLLGALFVVSAVVASPTHSHSKRAFNVYSDCQNNNQIALTFDDGPWIHLRGISDAFTNAGAKATFFWNGNNYDCIYNQDRVSDMQYAYNAGHQIGSHTWSHADLTTLSNDQIVDGMYRVEEALAKILGVLPGFMRPPFGSTNGNVQSISFSRNQNVALWDQDTQDADGASVDFSKGVYNQIVNDHPSNALVLEHETVDTTASTLVPYAINLFQNAGYQLVTFAECVGTQPYQAIGQPQQRDSSWTCNGTPNPGEACGGNIPCKSGTPPLNGGGGGGGTNPPPTGGQVIHPNGNTGVCLSAASNSDGAVVQLESCSGDASQSWTVNGSNLQIFGNKCLDVTNGNASNGNKMQIWTCAGGNTNQMWNVNGGAISWIGQPFCLDNTDGSFANGNPTQIWQCTGGPNQQWQFVNA